MKRKATQELATVLATLNRKSSPRIAPVLAALDQELMKDLKAAEEKFANGPGAALGAKYKEIALDHIRKRLDLLGEINERGEYEPGAKERVPTRPY